MPIRSLLFLCILSIATWQGSANESYNFSVLDMPNNAPFSEDTKIKRAELKAWYIRKITKADFAKGFSFERLYVRTPSSRDGFIEQTIAVKAREELALLYPVGGPIEKLKQELTVKDHYAISECKEIPDRVLSCRYNLVASITNDQAAIIQWLVKVAYTADGKIIEFKKIGARTEAIPLTIIPFH